MYENWDREIWDVGSVWYHGSEGSGAFLYIITKGYGSLRAH